MLLGLLVLGSVLRLWDLPHIPYTHDEISALVREYPSLSETVSKGVIEQDTHPPGVQVFEWVWTKLFGMGEAAVKLPFIIMSLLALFFLYRFTFAWCGGNVALLVTALLATLQYTVLYGQIARPYAAGLFTTALVADQLTRYLGNGSRKALIGLAIAALLSAYTHHFAAMLAAFMVFTGWGLLDRAKRKEYLIACGSVALLYVPNIPIFLKQLGEKGLDEWLAPPTASWIPDYLYWIAHCSMYFAALLALLFLVSAVQRIRHRGSIGPLWAIALLWGLTPLAIGYAYSVWRAPVLQYSVVLFSFPYLLIGTLAGLRHLRRSWGPPIAAVVAAVSVFTLVVDRKHYEVFYRSKYEAILKGVVEASKLPDRSALVDMPDEVPGFYFKHWGIDAGTTPYINLRGKKQDFLDGLLASTNATSIFLGVSAGSTMESLARVQHAFPFLLERHDMYEGQTFLFSGMPGSGTLVDLSHESMVTPDALKGEGWTVDADLATYRDTSGTFKTGPNSWNMEGREFGAVFERSVFELTTSDNDILEAHMSVSGVDPNSELKLVMELKEGDRSVFYRTSEDGSSAGSTELFAAIPLSDLPKHGQGARLKVYPWNPGGKAAHILSMQVRVRKGDPWLYGLFQPLKEPLEFP